MYMLNNFSYAQMLCKTQILLIGMGQHRNASKTRVSILYNVKSNNKAMCPRTRRKPINFSHGMHLEFHKFPRAKHQGQVVRKVNKSLYYMSIEIYVKYSAEIKFVFHCILYFSHVKKVVSAL